ncbi:MAG: hypothetical protein GYB41_16405 [Oceanospirillales bacterium]|nr:hypothetical protein [Oceanospirillales bacterium]
MQLTRLTTQFVENEDRFLISAESDVGGVNLWLTQRLLRRLLPHLIEWVGRRESGTAVEAMPGPGQPASDAPPAAVSSTRQVNRQLVAQHRQPLARVPADTATLTCLVHALQFQPRDKVLRIVFALPDNEAVLLLQEEHARIWLGVLYKHWQQAQWPDVWPDWMKQAQRMRLESPVSLMH